MTARTVFVTGGGGFVGRRVLAELGRAGWTITALDRSGALDGASAPGGTIVRGDLLAPETYRKAVGSCSVVVHLAAATGRAPASEHQRINAQGTEVLLDACRTTGVSRILFVSSIATTFPARSTKA